MCELKATPQWVECQGDTVKEDAGWGLLFHPVSEKAAHHGFERDQQRNFPEAAGKSSA